MKQTNASRAMVADLVRGLLPSTWRRYTVAPACTVIQVLFIFRTHEFKFLYIILNVHLIFSGSQILLNVSNNSNKFPNL